MQRAGEAGFAGRHALKPVYLGRFRGAYPVARADWAFAACLPTNPRGLGASGKSVRKSAWIGHLRPACPGTPARQGLREKTAWKPHGARASEWGGWKRPKDADSRRGRDKKPVFDPDVQCTRMPTGMAPEILAETPDDEMP